MIILYYLLSWVYLDNIDVSFPSFQFTFWLSCTREGPFLSVFSKARALTTHLLYTLMKVF